MRTPAPRHLPAADDITGRVVLKDGSVVVLRRAQPTDLDRMAAFFQALSPGSRYQRFFGAKTPGPDVLRSLCNSADPRRAVTVVAVRSDDPTAEIVGAGSYVRMTDTVAEVAFAVSDALQGKGIATAMLEHLSVDAALHGFRTFRATTLSDNIAMLDVFSRSGFQLTSAPDKDIVEVELTTTPTPAGVAAAEARETQATVTSLRPLLEPDGVVVVGASRNVSAIGRRVLDAIVSGGHAGRLYPVNRAAEAVAGLTAYASVRDVPAHVDLAIIAVPAEHVLKVVDDCAAAGVKALVMITAGFAETGADGRLLQQQLVDKVRGYGMRMVGPNCMGLISAAGHVSLNASFSPIMPPAGHLAFLSQSGALGVVVLSMATRRGVGLSSFVSVGNKADISGNDFLQYWEQDPATSVIALYLESFGNPRRFARLARRVGRTKPIIAVKAGRTGAGARAAGSHTAALAASDTAVDALFKQTGVIRAATIDELFDVAACLEAQPLPAGSRVAIVTNAGGPGILAADACQAAGLSVVEFDAATSAALRACLPAGASVGNPVDMVASAGAADYRRVIEICLAAPEADAVLILYTSVDSRSTADVIAAIRDGIASARRIGGRTKTIATCLMADQVPAILDLNGEQVPVYPFPENAARALGKAAAYAEWRRQPPGIEWMFDDASPAAARAICRAVVDARGADWLTREEVTRVLGAAGIVVEPTVLARSEAEAASTARVMGFPVVLKLSARGLIHKTEVSGVVAHLANAAAVEEAFRTLANRAAVHGLTLEGVMVQRMITEGIETMVGVTHDRLFGPLVGFGLGGTAVEVLGDMSFRVAPLTDRDIRELVAETRASTMLQGHRGRPPADVPAVHELLSRISSLVDGVPEIFELDLNPVIVGVAGEGCHVVDVRIKVA